MKESSKSKFETSEPGVAAEVGRRPTLKVQGSKFNLLRQTHYRGQEVQSSDLGVAGEVTTRLIGEAQTDTLKGGHRTATRIAGRISRIRLSLFGVHPLGCQPAWRSIIERNYPLRCARFRGMALPRTKKRQRTAALQDLSESGVPIEFRTSLRQGLGSLRPVLECGCPLPLCPRLPIHQTRGGGS
jgi:hypothetical protein